jgi:sulfotransferase
MTSPVGALFSGMLNQFSAGSEFGPVIDQPMRRRLLRSLFDTYYADHADKGLIFDTRHCVSNGERRGKR